MDKKINGCEMILQPSTDITSDKVKELVTKSIDYIDSQEGITEIVLDMGRVRIIDSVGISFVIGLFKSARSLKKQFRVTGLSTDIEKLFTMMKLNEVFRISDS